MDARYSSIMQAAGESPAVCSRFQSCANRIFAAPRIHAPGGFFFAEVTHEAQHRH